MSIRAFLFASVAAATLASPALAQVTGPAEFEGPVGSLTDTEIVVFNTKINSAAATYSTPTRDSVPLADVTFCATQGFAGRTIIENNAWIGGTGIVAGTTDGIDVIGEGIFLEPAENVLIGKITKVPGSDGTGTFEISGTEVVVMPKVGGPSFPTGKESSFSKCIPGLGIKNEFGFEIPASTLAVGQDAVAEGWFSNDGSKVFYAFLIDGVGQPDQGSVPMQVSITRAQCRERTTAQPWTVEWEIRGGTANPAAGTVRIGYGTNQTATATADPANPPFGAWLYKSRLTNQTQRCPNEITASFTAPDPANPAATKTVTATTAVEVRR